MTDFATFVRSLGLRPLKPIQPDGKVYRCPTEDKPKRRNGAYMLAVDGRMGWVQDWATMDEPAIWKPGEDADLPEFNPEKLRRAWEEDRRKKAEATKRARAFYGRCEPLRNGHPYLESHGLDMTGCFGLKVDRKGWLVIPARRGRKIQTVQRIGPDGDKRFFPGAPVSGSSYWIEPQRGRAVVTVICEGLATGLALYRAVPHSRVIVAWNTGNLLKLDDLPSGLTVFAADNDHQTEAERGTNPGIDAAREAAERVGCGFAHPEDISGTDWSDYRQERAEAIGEPGFGGMGQTLKRVDAEIRRQIMREARFVS